MFLNKKPIPSSSSVRKEVQVLISDGPMIPNSFAIPRKPPSAYETFECQALRGVDLKDIDTNIPVLDKWSHKPVELHPSFNMELSYHTFKDRLWK